MNVKTIAGTSSFRAGKSIKADVLIGLSAVLWIGSIASGMLFRQGLIISGALSALSILSSSIYIVLFLGRKK